MKHASFYYAVYSQSSIIINVLNEMRVIKLHWYLLIILFNRNSIEIYLFTIYDITPHIEYN